MMPREFGANFPQPVRDIDNDAPAAMRVEWVQATFDAGRNSGVAALGEARLYALVNGTLGIVNPAVNPYGGVQHRAQQYVVAADWIRFFDLVIRVAAEFNHHGIGAEYRTIVNRLLAAHAIAWNMANDGRLERVVPAAAQPLIAAAQEALQRHGYRPAYDLFLLAKDAFDARPRRDRDVCANAFDAMESAAKIQMAMPTRTFGPVVDAAAAQHLVNAEIRGMLQRLEVVRHNHCGHGMAQPFALTPAEVDLFYMSCLMGANLFARLRP